MTVPILAATLGDAWQDQDGMSTALLTNGSKVVATGVADLVKIEPGPAHISRAAKVASQADGEVFAALGFSGDAPGMVWRPESVDPVWVRAPSFQQIEPVNYDDSDAPGFVDSVQSAIGSIESGQLSKVVLARRLLIVLDDVPNIPHLLARLHAADMSALTYAVPWDGGIMVGSTPELLVKVVNGVVSTEAVAGSVARSSDPNTDANNADALMDSKKDRQEHQIVVDGIVESLGVLCDDVDFALKPDLRRTSQAWHLVTPITGSLMRKSTSLDVAAALHPTASVCGTPGDKAQSFIERQEPFKRELYTGLIGRAQPDGDGEWHVVLRGALLQGSMATLYAGAGIVEGSAPQAELAETDYKMQVILTALGVAQPSRNAVQ